MNYVHLYCALLITLVYSFSKTCVASETHEQFFSSFSILSTIAGTGTFDGDENGWQKQFEGKTAIESELSRPHIAMADSAGNIYIADKMAHAIRKVYLNGVITTLAGTNTPGDGGEGIATEQALNSPNGLWVNKRGDCYILDLGNNKIRKVTVDGMMSTLIHDTSGISIGRGLWFNTAEDTAWYACGSRIKMWSKNKGISVYSDGFSGSCANIMQDKNGFLCVTDRSDNRVYRIDATGNKTIIAGNGAESGGGDGISALETGFFGVRGIWFIDDNSYFLATHEGSQVWYIDIHGIAHLFIDGKEGDEFHNGDGEHFQTTGFKVSEVRAVTVDYEGNVLITENDRGFIRRVKKKSAAIRPLNHTVRSNFFHSLPNGSGISIQNPSSKPDVIKMVTPRGTVLSSNAILQFSSSEDRIILLFNELTAGYYYLILQYNNGTRNTMRIYYH